MPLWTDRDITEIPNPDPETHYFWCPAEPMVLIDYLQSGYSLVTGLEEVTRLYGSEDTAKALLDAMGRCRRADTVLTKMPLGRWKEIELIINRKAEDNRNSPIEAFHSAIDRIGSKHISSYEMPVEEHLDRKRHATREGNPRVGYTGPSRG